jgi:hypothetical protein
MNLSFWQVVCYFLDTSSSSGELARRRMHSWPSNCFSTQPRGRHLSCDFISKNRTPRLATHTSFLESRCPDSLHWQKLSDLVPTTKNPVRITRPVCSIYVPFFLLLTFTFRAFSRCFYPKRLTIRTFVRRKRNNISLAPGGTVEMFIELRAKH